MSSADPIGRGSTGRSLRCFHPSGIDPAASSAAPCTQRHSPREIARVGREFTVLDSITLLRRGYTGRPVLAFSRHRLTHAQSVTLVIPLAWLLLSAGCGPSDPLERVR